MFVIIYLMGGEWYKEAIIYELHVKCFYDSAGDGIGDFKGLTQKLDYLLDLGVTAIWLLPFYPSPLKDDGYDIADYHNVLPAYGTLKDFKTFLREAHRRGLKVITELVINHTSDQHPWFQRARQPDATPSERDFYVWSDNPDKYRNARVIFQDFEPSNWTWDRIAGKYYWHRFYSHQPDVNFENPKVQKEILRILSFWLEMGVDGFRLDAVPYLYEREGTSCENLPETHLFLQKLRSYVDTHFKERMLLAEANQWPEDAAKYFGEGNECHMAFHFPLMPRLFMAIHLEDALPIIEIMEQTPEIPQNCQWALFLRNHDELTLEMVTDEERDYMWRVYAHDPQARLNLGIRRRLAPLLKNDRRKIELMNTLLFSLNGTPVLYYGDEIGMGDNIYLGDRNGVRTPMQWSSDRNAGFSTANPQQLYLPPILDPEYHYETVNVEAQLKNPESLLWWTKQLIALRKRFKALGYGSTRFLSIDNRKVLVFFRSYGEELIMIVANLSRFPQYVELDLREYAGYSLVEIFSSERFPSIGELPYFLTLGAYGYYWFCLEKEKSQIAPSKPATIELKGKIDSLFQMQLRPVLEVALRNYLLRREPLFRAPKIDKLKVNLADLVLLDKKNLIYLAIMQVPMTTGVVNYFPLFLLTTKEEKLGEENRISFIHTVAGMWNLYHLRESALLNTILMRAIAEEKRVKHREGEVRGVQLKPLEGSLIRTYLQEEVEPDVEIRQFLAERTQFKSFIPLTGYCIYGGVQKLYLALAEKRIDHVEENAKGIFVEAARRFLQKMETLPAALDESLIIPKKSWGELVQHPIPHELLVLLDAQNEVAALLGETTALLHQALVSEKSRGDFSPIPHTIFYQRSLYQTMRVKGHEAVGQLKKVKSREEVQKFWDRFLKCIEIMPRYSLTCQRIRNHGNYILENMIYEGKTFIVTHFGGKVSLSQAERKYKRAAIRDLSAMLYSIAEAGFDAVEKLHAQGLVKDYALSEKWALGWSIWVGNAFLAAYLKLNSQLSFMPKIPQESDLLIGLFLIELCVETLGNAEDPHFRLAYNLLNHELSLYEGFKIS